jgi:hypothetical protein
MREYEGAGGGREEEGEGEKTHHIRNRILDLENVLTLRADHLAVTNHNLCVIKTAYEDR